MPNHSYCFPVCHDPELYPRILELRKFKKEVDEMLMDSILCGGTIPNPTSAHPMDSQRPFQPSEYPSSSYNPGSPTEMGWENGGWSVAFDSLVDQLRGDSNKTLRKSRIKVLPWSRKNPNSLPPIESQYSYHQRSHAPQKTTQHPKTCCAHKNLVRLTPPLDCV